MKKTLIWCAAIFFCGCLNFGDNLELRGEKFSSKYIEQVTRLTGIKFPAGTHGIAYLYLGSGIDSSIAAKLEIPEEKKDELLKNDIFEKGQLKAPVMQIGKSRKWWLLNTLKERIDRVLDLPNARLLECSVGKEKDSLIIYISWSET
ncbi:MAG: hypothetical protein NT014_01845 [Candidatus Omnitrophica bacterium]|nr:hypothetical protein [Candidatus Omnitrophota bacterium]